MRSKRFHLGIYEEPEEVKHWCSKHKIQILVFLFVTLEIISAIAGFLFLSEFKYAQGFKAGKIAGQQHESTSSDIQKDLSSSRKPVVHPAR